MTSGTGAGGPEGSPPPAPAPRRRAPASGRRAPGNQADEARRLIQETEATARPVEQIPSQAGLGMEPQAELGGGTRALNELLSRSPFFDYFCRVAERSYTAKDAAKRVQDAHKAHKVLFAFCVIADMILRVLVALILLAVIVAVLYKTLSPLPGTTTPEAPPATTPVAPSETAAPTR
jgi:hypothetical protein